MSRDTLITIVVVLLGSSTTAQLIAQYIAWRNTSRVAKVAAETAAQAKADQIKAQENQVLAQQAAQHAAEQVVQAAKLLIQSGAVTTKTLADIGETSKATHKLVNSQRTVMLRLIVSLARRIAQENPNDQEAQRALLDAEHNLRVAEENESANR